MSTHVVDCISQPVLKQSLKTLTFLAMPFFLMSPTLAAVNRDLQSIWLYPAP